MTPSGNNGTGILVKCRVHPLALVLLVCRTTIMVDGASVRGRWGEHFFPCGPGSHRVEVSFRYLGKQLGHAVIEVPVAESATVRVTYQSPWMFSLFLTSRYGSIWIDNAPVD
jgi:hypothetical protein